MNAAPRDDWYAVDNVGEIPSPALLVYADRLEENLRIMRKTAGGTERLRPHLKTVKMGEVVRLLLRHGIGKCKCATVAEAEMAARSGSRDILLALQPVGPQQERFLALGRSYPESRFSVIADDGEVLRSLSREAHRRETEATVFLDIDNGMHRTGIAPGPEAVSLYRMLSALPGLKAGGLHVYDGHIRESDLQRRIEAGDADYAPVERMIGELRAAGCAVPAVVAGGTPTFPVHARRPEVELSPGTCLLWDEGYGTRFPDLGFSPAALVLSRIVSKPGGNRICLDLGHKAVASEMPPPRVRLLGLEDALFLSHSEEHLVLESADAARWNVGDPVWGIPMHICPTVARFDRAVVVRGRRADGEWKIEAQNRKITI